MANAEAPDWSGYQSKHYPNTLSTSSAHPELGWAEQGGEGELGESRSPLSALQNVIAEHEIRNISCAAQDPEDLCTFAYITKDLQTSHHYCHVFSTVDVVGGPVSGCRGGPDEMDGSSRALVEVSNF